MFKDKLKQDIDRISPSPELLDKVSLMMREQTEKPRPKPYVYAVRYAGMAAAICLIAFGAVQLGLFGGTSNSTTGASFKAEMAADMNSFDGYAAEAPAAAAPVSQETVPETSTAAATNIAATYAAQEDAYIDGYAPEPPSGAAEPIVAGGIVSEAPDNAPTGYANELDDSERNIPAENFESAAVTGASAEYIITVYPRKAAYTGHVGVRLTDRAIYTFDEAAGRIARNDASSLCYVKILETLPDERSSLNFANGCTIYRAEVNDLISGETYERNVCFSGTAEFMEYGNPIFQAGDELLCETETVNGEMIIRDYPLCDVYDTPAGKAAYIRIAPMDTDGVKKYAAGLEMETTAPTNPAQYHGIYDYEEFSRAFVNEIKAAKESPAG